MLQSRFTTLGPSAVFALTIILAAGCGGGGGGSTGPGGGGPPPTSAPTPTPTPVVGFACNPINVPGPAATSFPGSLPPANPLVPSAVTIDSAPQGLAVTIDGAPAGKTPLTQTPSYSSSPHTITVGTYTFTYSQVAGGPQTLFFNQTADTNVRVGSISASSTAHGAAANMRTQASLDEVNVRRTPAQPHGSLFKSDRLAVRYDDARLRAGGRSARDIEASEQITRGSDIGPPGEPAARVVFLSAGASPDTVAARLRRHPEVASVDRVALRFLKSSVPVTVNDTHFLPNEQWDMFQIGAPNAWSYTCGTPSIAVAIIDTGFDANHADLQGKVSYAENDVASQSGGVKVGLSVAQDTDGHGTNVSGIAAADTNNGFGFAGVGYNVSLMEFKIFGDGPNAGAGTDDEAQAIYDAIAHGARVINLSIGSTQDQGPDALESAAIAKAIASNVVVVAASGNETLNTVDFPGAYPGVISVGATSLRDNNTGNPANATEYVASYSNAGAGLSMVAPGGDPSGTADSDFLHWIYNIYTTTPFDKTQACKNVNDCKALFAGTSQATPHVAGAAGLLIAKNPALSGSQIAHILMSTADNINDPKQGAGRLNVYRAMASVAGDVAPALPQANNFVAIAYAPGSGNRPNILNVTSTRGVRPDANGNFRIADLRPGLTYRIGLWYDANGDGIVDAGDWFGAGPTCSSSSLCPGGPINVAPVPVGFVLQ